MNFAKVISDELKKKGWNSERKIDLKEIMNTLNEEGYEINDNCIKFFEQFGMLEFEHPAYRVKNQNERIHFNPLESCGHIYREKVEIYELRIGESLVVIGEAYNGNLTRCYLKMVKSSVLMIIFLRLWEIRLK